MNMNRDNVERLGSGFVGAILIFFVGWQWHIAIAIWLSVILLVRFFRMTEKWYGTLPG